jgi:hypothetical protein
MLFLKVIIIAFAHKKNYRKMPKVRILLKMAKSLTIKYNLSNIFTYLDRP